MLLDSVVSSANTDFYFLKYCASNSQRKKHDMQQNKSSKLPQEKMYQHRRHRKMVTWANSIWRIKWLVLLTFKRLFRRLEENSSRMTYIFWNQRMATFIKDQPQNKYGSPLSFWNWQTIFSARAYFEQKFTEGAFLLRIKRPNSLAIIWALDLTFAFPKTWSDQSVFLGLTCLTESSNLHFVSSQLSRNEGCLSFWSIGLMAVNHCAYIPRANGEWNKLSGFICFLLTANNGIPPFKTPWINYFKVSHFVVVSVLFVLLIFQSKFFLPNFSGNHIHICVQV